MYSSRFSLENASRRGLSSTEMTAVDAIHRAVEFNPHVPKVSIQFGFAWYLKENSYIS